LSSEATNLNEKAPALHDNEAPATIRRTRHVTSIVRVQVTELGQNIHLIPEIRTANIYALLGETEVGGFNWFYPALPPRIIAEIGRVTGFNSRIRIAGETLRSIGVSTHDVEEHFAK